MDYGTYEGRLITCLFRNGRDELEKSHGIVTGCDEDLGITIMNHRKTEYLFCLIGPSAPNKDTKKLYKEDEELLEYYKKMFNVTIKGIERGVVSDEDYEGIEEPQSQRGFGANDPSEETCPFAQ